MQRPLYNKTIILLKTLIHSTLFYINTELLNYDIIRKGVTGKWGLLSNTFRFHSLKAQSDCQAPCCPLMRAMRWPPGRRCWSLSQQKLLCNTQRKARVTGQLRMQHNHQTPIPTADVKTHPASVISSDTLHGRAWGGGKEQRPHQTALRLFGGATRRIGERATFRVSFRFYQSASFLPSAWEPISITIGPFKGSPPS